MMIIEPDNKSGKITNNAFNPCFGARLRRLHPHALFSEDRAKERIRPRVANSKTERVQAVKHVKLDIPNARKAMESLLQDQYSRALVFFEPM